MPMPEQPGPLGFVGWFLAANALSDTRIAANAPAWRG
jgi:hypothetical protein